MFSPLRNQGQNSVRMGALSPNVGKRGANQKSGNISNNSRPKDALSQNSRQQIGQVNISIPEASNLSLTPSHIQKTAKATSRADNAKQGGRSTQRFSSNKIYLNIKDIDNQKTSIMREAAASGNQDERSSQIQTLKPSQTFKTKTRQALKPPKLTARRLADATTTIQSTKGQKEPKAKATLMKSPTGQGVKKNTGKAAANISQRQVDINLHNYKTQNLKGNLSPVAPKKGTVAAQSRESVAGARKKQNAPKQSAGSSKPLEQKSLGAKDKSQRLANTVRERMNMKNEALFDQNSGYLSSLDPETQGYIRNFMQQQVEQTVRQQLEQMSYQTQSNEAQMRLYIQKQDESFQKILKMNENKSQSQIQELKNQMQNIKAELREVSVDQNQSSQRDECSGINPTGHSFMSDVSGLSLGNGFDIRKQPSNCEPSLNEMDFKKMKQSHTEMHKAEKLSQHQDSRDASYNLNVPEFKLNISQNKISTANSKLPQPSSGSLQSQKQAFSPGQHLQIIREERRTPNDAELKSKSNNQENGGIDENFEVTQDSQMNLSDRFVNRISGDEKNDDQFIQELNNAINQSDDNMIFHQAGYGQNQELIKDRINRAKNQRNLQIHQSHLAAGNPNLRPVDVNSSSSMHTSQRASFKSYNQTIKSGAGGMKSYLNHSNNALMSPKSNYSGVPSNYSVRSGAFLEPTGSPEMGGRGALSHQAPKPGASYGNQQVSMHSHFALSTNRNSSKTNQKEVQRANMPNYETKKLFQSKNSNYLIKSQDSREKSISSAGGGTGKQVNNFLQHYNLNHNSQNVSEQNMYEQNMDFDDVVNFGAAAEAPNTQQTMKYAGRIAETKGTDYGNIRETESEKAHPRNEGAQLKNDGLQSDSHLDSMTQNQLLPHDIDSGDEFDVPDEDSNLRFVEKSLGRITVTSMTQSQGKHSLGNMQDKRLLMRSQMQVQPTKNLANSPPKTQLRGITSLDRQQKKFNQLVLSVAKKQQTAPNVQPRKQNVNVKSFNLNANHQRLLEEQRSMSHLMTNQQLGRYSNTKYPQQANQTQVRQMMTARDKSQALNLPGRSQSSLLNAFQIYMGQQSTTSQRNTKELAAQPASYTSLSNTSEHTLSRQPNSNYQAAIKNNAQNKPEFSLANSVPMSSPLSAKEVVATSIKSEGGRRPNPFTTALNMDSKSIQDLQININDQKYKLKQPGSVRASMKKDENPLGQAAALGGAGDSTSLHQKASSLEKYSNPSKLTLNSANDLHQLKHKQIVENLGLRTMPLAMSQKGEAIIPSLMGADLYQCTCVGNRRAGAGAFAGSMPAFQQANSINSPFKSPHYSDDEAGEDDQEYSHGRSYSNRNQDQDDNDLGTTQKVIRPVLKNPFKSRGMVQEEHQQSFTTTCGEYCKNLTPEQERTIILECLRKNIADYYSQSEQGAKDPGARPLSMQQRLSQPYQVSDQEMAKFAKSNVSLNLMTAKENGKRYLVGAQWWREWCDYANFDLSQLIQTNQDFARATDSRVHNRENDQEADVLLTNPDDLIIPGNQSEKKTVEDADNQLYGAILSHKDKQNAYGKHRDSRQSRGSSLSRNSNGVGGALDSAKQREVDFRTELQNLKRQKSKEKRQQFMDGKISPSQSNSANSPSRLKSGFGGGNPGHAYHALNIAHRDSTPSSYYKRPAAIRNQHLLKNDNNSHLYNTQGSQKLMNNMYLFLKDDLIEHFDLEAVSVEVWQHLRAWYDCDFPLLRFIKQDRVNHNELFLDMYPEKRMANGGMGNNQNNNENQTTGENKLNTARMTTLSGDCSALSSGRDIWLKSQNSGRERGSSIPDSYLNSPQYSQTRAQPMPSSSKKGRPWGQKREHGSQSAMGIRGVSGPSDR